jgi:peptidoglycan/xylan/chitin deacetylase (PgdA/CDA1 family)
VVVALVQKGSDGERETFVGDTTNRTAAEFVTREPVDAVLRRSPGVTAGQKAVALTFDDGPSTFTPEIMAVLAEKSISATFFWVGNVAAGRPEMIGRAREAGHEVENHTWSHADLTTLDAEAIKSEISRAEQTLGGTRFVRPPYAAYNSSVVEQAGALGQRLVLWDVDTLDWKIREALSIVSRVQAAVRPGAVILMHDGGGDRSQTVAALPAVIDWLLNEGYALTTVQHLVD